MADTDITNVTEDGGVTKKILQKGENDIKPASGQIINVLYKGTLLDGTVFDQNQDVANPFEFTLGGGEVIKAWDLAVATMTKGEIAVVTCKPQYAYGDEKTGKIPPQSTLIFEIKLLDFHDREKTKWDYTPEQRLEIATKWKNEGNTFFTKKINADALKFYNQALEYVEDDQNEASVEMKKTCLLNITQVQLNEKDYSKACEAASKVLLIDDKNLKALYRRGVAALRKEDLENASIDLSKAFELDKKNKEIQFALKELQAKRKIIHKKEKNMFAQMFKANNGTLYEDQIPDNSLTNYSHQDNPIVYMDIKIGESAPERMEFELFKNLVPKTVENFRALCTGEKGQGQCEKPLHYKNSIFHRLIKDFMIQGGDFELANGTGGESIYGKKFDDENFKAQHLGRGYLSMANSGANTNGSQFFITFKETSWLNNKHVVFGKIHKNMELLDKIEKLETEGQDIPKDQIIVVDCGEVKKEN